MTLARILAAAALAAAVFCAAAAEPWLVGRWVMNDDPDAREKDWIVFTADGRFESAGQKSPPVGGTYKVAGSNIVLTVVEKGKSGTVRMVASSDRTKLYHYSGRTTAEYEKRK